MVHVKYVTLSQSINPVGYEAANAGLHLDNQLRTHKVSGNFLPPFLTDLNLGNDLS